MKKLLLFALCLPMIVFGQNVNIPDANFKAYLVGEPLINTNGDTEIQVSEATAFNDGIYCDNMNISDLTGIEAFTSIIYLLCQNNQLSSLYLADNTSLYALVCSNNQLTSLDFSNGNNTMTNSMEFKCYGNPNLFCINVDDPVFSTATWVNIDSQIQFSTNCATEIYGCTDSLACNYNATATIDDGSCVYPTNDTLTITACDSYDWLHFDDTNSWSTITETQSGIYTSTLWGGFTNSGCDSIFTLDLTIINSSPPEANSTDTTVFCSYTWPVNGQTYYSSIGTVYHTDISIYGCDSMSQLNLTIDTIVYNTTNITACDEYVWPVSAITYNTSGTYTWVGTNSNGCTQTDTLNLTITNAIVTDTRTECDSYSCQWYDSATYSWYTTSFSQSGVYTYIWHDTLNLVCDTTFILDLTINNSTSNTTTASACDTYYTWSVDGTAYTTSGTYTDVSTNVNGCTHTETLNLTVNSSTSNTTTATACDTYTWAVDGNTYLTSGTYVEISIVPTGSCPQIDTLNLIINNSTTSTDTQVSCDAYTWIDGLTYVSSNNSATHTIPNASGCDSIITLNLTLNNSSIGTTIATSCDTYTWAVDGTAYTTSGTYTDVSTNANGCTHTETLNLTVNSSTSNTTTATACETYTWAVDGTAYTTSGTYTDVSTNANGCTHTETLNLTVNSSTSNTTTATACETYTWAVDGTAYTTSGTYTDVSTNANGCTHTETLNLTVNSILASINQSGDSLFATTTPIGLNADWYNIQTENGSTRIWLMEEGVSSFTPTFECSYFIVVSDNGCADTSETYYFGATAKRIGSLVTSPNPTRGLINVKFENTKNQFVYLHLMNGSGVKLDDFITKENELTINLSKYPSGTYYLYFDSSAAKQGCNPEDTELITTKIILNK